MPADTLSPAPGLLDDARPYRGYSEPHMIAVDDLLRARGYGLEARKRIAADLYMVGSAQCQPLIQEQDKDDVEKLLPGNPYEWAKWTDEVWTAGSEWDA